MITPEELKSVLYSYQIEQITDEDNDIVQEAIDTAEMLVRGYLDSANKRRETAGLSKQQYRAWKIYDIDAMFCAEGSERNLLLLRIIKRIAAFNIIELSCPDVLLDKMQNIYNDTITLLQRIAGEGEYAFSRYVIPKAIFISDSEEVETDGRPSIPSGLDLPFRMVSRAKFRHEPI